METESHGVDMDEFIEKFPEFAQFEDSLFKLICSANGFVGLDTRVPNVRAKVMYAVDEYNARLQMVKKYQEKRLQLVRVAMVKFIPMQSFGFYCMTFTAEDQVGNQSVYQATTIAFFGGLRPMLLDFYLVSGCSEALLEDMKHPGLSCSTLPIEPESSEEHATCGINMEELIVMFEKFAQFDGSCFTLMHEAGGFVDLNPRSRHAHAEVQFSIGKYNGHLKKKYQEKHLQLVKVVMAKYLPIKVVAFYFLTFIARDQIGNESMYQATTTVSYVVPPKPMLLEFYLVSGRSEALEEEMKNSVFHKLQRDLINSLPKGPPAGKCEVIRTGSKRSRCLLSKFPIEACSPEKENAKETPL